MMPVPIVAVDIATLRGNISIDGCILIRTKTDSDITLCAPITHNEVQIKLADGSIHVGEECIIRSIHSGTAATAVGDVFTKYKNSFILDITDTDTLFGWRVIERIALLLLHPTTSSRSIYVCMSKDHFKNCIETFKRENARLYNQQLL